MKTLKSLTTLIVLALACISYTTIAQTVSLQIFNGASGVMADTLDVYINGTKLDNIPLGYFTAPLHVPSGNSTISINDKTSTSVSDKVLKTEVSNFTYATGGFEAYNIFIVGVETPAQYAPNPNGKATGIHTWSFPKGNRKTVPSTQTAFATFIHGSTDLPLVNYITRKDTLVGRKVLFDGLSDVSLAASVGSITQTLDITDSVSNNYYGAFDLPLNLYKGKIIFPFVTGFLNPANNKNGIPLTLFLVDWFDTLGGQVNRLNLVPKPKGTFQFIHNSPTVSMDTIDVYINGVKYNTDNLAFRKGSAEISLDAGLYRVNINRKNSSDSGNFVIKRFAPRMTKDHHSIWMLAGVDSTTYYAGNPDGMPNTLQLLSFWVYPNVFSGTRVSFIQGSTDAPGLKFQSRAYFGSSSPVTRFSDTPSSTPAISILDNIIDLIVSQSAPPLRSFEPAGITAPGYQRRIAFTSGFLNPATNRNGVPLSLVFIDSAGNANIANPIAGVRFLHNSADTSMPAVDIWVDNNPILKTANLGFRKATGSLPIALGQHTLTVMKTGSTDTSDVSKQLYKTTFDFQAGKNYVMMLCGVKDTTRYAPNPDTLAIGLRFTPIHNFAESASESSIRFVNGVTDSKSIISPFFLPAVYAPFSVYSPGVATVTPPFNLIMRSKDSSIIYARLKYPNNFQSSLLFSSGFANTAGNPKSGAPIKFFVLAADNSVTELANVIPPKVQILHLATDIPELDVYINKKLAVAGLKRFTISPVIDCLPNISQEIAYSLKDSGYSKVFSSFNAFLGEEDEKTFATYGLQKPANYKPNPGGYNTSFGTSGYFDVTRTPTSTGSCQISLFLGSTDLPEVDVMDQPTFSPMVVTGPFKYAGSFVTFSNGKSGTIKWTMGYSTDSFPSKLIKGTLKNRSGLSGIAFFAGFADTAWQNPFGEKPQLSLPLRIMIAWPDQQMDTLSIEKYTGLAEAVNGEAPFTLYPSPASTIVSVRSKQTFEGYSIFHITGAKVAEAKLQSSLNPQIDISLLAKGVYILRLTGSNGQQYAERFVVK